MQNELIDLMANEMKNKNTERIMMNGYFSVSGDETKDANNNSVFSVTIRTVNIYFDADKVLNGLCSIPNKKAVIISNLALVCIV